MQNIFFFFQKDVSAISGNAITLAVPGDAVPVAILGDGVFVAIPEDVVSVDIPGVVVSVDIPAEGVVIEGWSRCIGMCILKLHLLLLLLRLLLLWRRFCTFATIQQFSLNRPQNM